MDLTATNRSGKTLDEVLEDIKDSLITDNKIETVEKELSNKTLIIPSIISDPNKYIHQKSDKSEIDVNSIYGNIDNINNLYLEGRRDKKGMLDEHPFMGKLSCKSRTEYCFTNKKLSKQCFTIGNKLHDTYILPCKLRAELKKLINFICKQDIEKYKDLLYLRKSPIFHFTNILPHFNFSIKEINILVNCGKNIITGVDILQMDITTEYGRGIYMKYLLNLFIEEPELLTFIVNKFINGLIVKYKFTELDAIESGFKFLNTLVLGSDTVSKIEEHYLENKRIRIKQMKQMWDSDSE